MEGDAFSQDIRNIQEELWEKIKMSNENYKEAANMYRKFCLV